MENIDIDIDKEVLENIDIYIDINKEILENIGIDIDINKEILENIDNDIDIDKEILANIDIDKISNRLEFGISNSTSLGWSLEWSPHKNITHWLTSGHNYCCPTLE